MSKTEVDNIVPEVDVIKYFQGRGILSKLKRTPLTYGELTSTEISALRVHMTNNGYKDITEEFLKIIAMNKRRNTVIVNKLIDLNLSQRLFHTPTTYDKDYFCHYRIQIRQNLFRALHEQQRFLPAFQHMYPFSCCPD